MVANWAVKESQTVKYNFETKDETLWSSKRSRVEAGRLYPGVVRLKVYELLALRRCAFQSRQRVTPGSLESLGPSVRPDIFGRQY